MSRPKGSKNRVRTVAFEAPPTNATAGGVIFIAEEPANETTIPPHWGRGALLNVRNTGADYVVTLFPEEYDPRSPERSMRFANPALCQDFVSRWYMRESADPRAR